MSSRPFVSPGTRLVALELKANQRPLSLTEGALELPLACDPSYPTEIRVLVCFLSAAAAVPAGTRATATPNAVARAIRARSSDRTDLPRVCASRRSVGPAGIHAGQYQATAFRDAPSGRWMEPTAGLEPATFRLQVA